MLIVRYCDTRDYGQLTRVSAQTQAGCRRYARLAVRLPPDWTIQRLGEEVRWLGRTLHLNPPPTTLAILGRWMETTAANGRLLQTAVHQHYYEMRESREPSLDCLIGCGCVSWCCVIVPGMSCSPLWGYLASWAAAGLGPVGLYHCCMRRADAENDEVVSRVIAFRRAWGGPLVAPTQTYGSITV